MPKEGKIDFQKPSKAWSLLMHRTKVYRDKRQEYTVKIHLAGTLQKKSAVVDYSTVNTSAEALTLCQDDGISDRIFVKVIFKTGGKSNDHKRAKTGNRRKVRKK